jgi:hypothetical protein
VLPISLTSITAAPALDFDAAMAIAAAASPSDPPPALFTTAAASVDAVSCLSINPLYPDLVLLAAGQFLHLLQTSSNLASISAPLSTRPHTASVAASCWTGSANVFVFCSVSTDGSVAFAEVSGQLRTQHLLDA